jgi:hypothetical protein
MIDFRGRLSMSRICGWKSWIIVLTLTGLGQTLSAEGKEKTTTAPVSGTLSCNLNDTPAIAPGTVIAIGGLPNYVWCSGVVGPRGGGAWKDTGVPNDQPAPTGPAQFRSAPEGPHPPLPPGEVKTDMDLFRGILFECFPSSAMDWSVDACKEISETMLRQATTEKMPIVVFEWPTAEEISRKKANEAGIPIDAALEWDITFTSVPGAIHIASKARGIVEILPGLYGKRQVFASNSNLQPTATANLALLDAKSHFKAGFEYLRTNLDGCCTR